MYKCLKNANSFPYAIEQSKEWKNKSILGLSLSTVGNMRYAVYFRRSIKFFHVCRLTNKKGLN